MKIKALAMTGCLAAAMAVPGLAKTNDNTFKALENFRRVADDAARQADKLQALAESDQTDWVVNGSYLTAVRNDVNRMGKMLANLQEMRDSATPAERAAIDKAAEWLPALAANTTEALNYLNKYQGEFWAPGFRNPVDALAVDSARIASATSDAVRLHELQAKARRLRRGLEAGA
jgi:hypothetical protein